MTEKTSHWTNSEPVTTGWYKAVIDDEIVFLCVVENPDPDNENAQGALVYQGDFDLLFGDGETYYELGTVKWWWSEIEKLPPLPLALTDGYTG